MRYTINPFTGELMPTQFYLGARASPPPNPVEGLAYFDINSGTLRIYHNGWQIFRPEILLALAENGDILTAENGDSLQIED